MIRAFLGLILGFLLFVVLAVAFGKSRDMTAADFEPVVLVAAGAGAVAGLGTAIATRKKR